jgi:large subunit ribosomal protein L24
MDKIKYKVKKGDTVIVIAGDDKGKKGRILEMLTSRNRAVVEGVNMVSKHTKPTSKYPQGGIIKKEAAIHLSNLMVTDSTGNPTRIGRRQDDKGKLVRYAKSNDELLK